MSINAQLTEQTRLAIKDVCQRMEAGKVSFIEGTRQILTLAPNAALKDDDPDLVLFQGIDSETDEVPSPKLLELWSADAAAKQAPVWGELECWAKSYGAAACRSLISRF